MSCPKTVLLINGSPKCEKSNSRVIAKFLVEKLQEYGLQSEEVFLARLNNKSESYEKFFKSLDNADIIVLATPLYVDCVPSFTIKAMEIICDRYKVTPPTKNHVLVGVMNSGFPEKEHMDVAIKTLQDFAKQSSFQWAGGITVGMGAGLNGKPLKEGQGQTKNLRKGLDLAALALTEGQQIPAEALELASKPFMPLFLAKTMLRVFGGLMWNRQAKKNKVKGKMTARPYEVT